MVHRGTEEEGAIGGTENMSSYERQREGDPKEGRGILTHEKERGIMVHRGNRVMGVNRSDRMMGVHRRNRRMGSMGGADECGQ